MPTHEMSAADATAILDEFGRNDVDVDVGVGGGWAWMPTSGGTTFGFEPPPGFA